jgi:hypothetical protein
MSAVDGEATAVTNGKRYLVVWSATHAGADHGVCFLQGNSGSGYVVVDGGLRSHTSATAVKQVRSTAVFTASSSSVTFFVSCHEFDGPSVYTSSVVANIELIPFN